MPSYRRRLAWVLGLCAAFLVVKTRAQPAADFVEVSTIDPTIKIEMRYAADWNFFGKIVPGYFANKCFLTEEAGKALAHAQAELRALGYGLLVFDCYRPQRGVSAFVDWTKDLKDQKMKTFFYASEDKDQLIERGYISSHSGHSRGSTVDLTLVRLPTTSQSFHEQGTDCRFPKNIESTGQVDMGTTYDCFSEMAYTASTEVTKLQSEHRHLLESVMTKSGFRPYAKEWWHFTLNVEPFPDQYFDFDVR